MEWISDPNAWIALAMLTGLEIVLGIDNIVFISILVARLPKEQRALGRTLGLSIAMLTRILLLFSLTWIMGLSQPWFHIASWPITGRELILILGGLFLMAKSTHEIHFALEGQEESSKPPNPTCFSTILIQIALLDIVFSLDSVITAVGLVDHLMIMVIAIIISVVVMILAAKSISEFVDNHPTIKMLALSFLILVGMTLFAEGFKVHIPKGYIYFAMFFSMGVEVLNLRFRKKQSDKVRLHKAMMEEKTAVKH